MLQVVNAQIVQSFQFLAMRSLPGSPGDNMRNEVRVVWDQLGLRSVPEDEEDHETHVNLEGEEGRDHQCLESHRTGVSQPVV